MALSRRLFLHTAGAAALESTMRPAAGAAEETQGATDATAGLPKICLGFYGEVNEASMRRVKQIGVDYVLTGGPPIPWTEADVRARIDRFKAGGLTLCNMMIGGFDDVIWGRPGADAAIEKVISSIRAAG